MANLDSRQKRASSVQIAAPWQVAPPLPDGTLDQGDRQHIAWCYAGIAAGAGIPYGTGSGPVTGAIARRTPSGSVARASINIALSRRTPTGTVST